MFPGAGNAKKELIEIVSIIIVDLEADTVGKVLYRIQSSFILLIGMDVRIIKISPRIHPLLLQSEIGIECTGSAAYMEENAHDK
jgi:hypothetical protein